MEGGQGARKGAHAGRGPCRGLPNPKTGAQGPKEGAQSPRKEALGPRQGARGPHDMRNLYGCHVVKIGIGSEAAKALSTGFKNLEALVKMSIRTSTRLDQ